MLPRRLYELLPYLYIVTGIVSASLIDSAIVLMSSMLLILAGVFVLFMRKRFRRSLQKGSCLIRLNPDAVVENMQVPRSGVERRCRTVMAWPIMDYTGSRIYVDRRVGERRISTTRYHSRGPIGSQRRGHNIGRRWFE